MARKIAAGSKPVKKEVNTGGFKPLATGRYEATIFGLVEGKYETKANKGLENLTVQFRISEGQPGTNRRLFDTFPMATEWLNGEDAFRFFQFGAAVTNRTEEEFRAYAAEQQEADKEIELPEDADLLGFPVTITVSVVDDKYAFDKAKETDPNAKPKDFQRNRITNVTVAGNGNMEGKGGSSDDGPPRPKAETLDL